MVIERMVAEDGRLDVPELAGRRVSVTLARPPFSELTNEPHHPTPTSLDEIFAEARRLARESGRTPLTDDAVQAVMDEMRGRNDA